MVSDVLAWEAEQQALQNLQGNVTYAIQRKQLNAVLSANQGTADRHHCLVLCLSKVQTPRHHMDTCSTSCRRIREATPCSDPSPPPATEAPASLRRCGPGGGAGRATLVDASSRVRVALAQSSPVIAGSLEPSAFTLMTMTAATNGSTSPAQTRSHPIKDGPLLC